MKKQKASLIEQPFSMKIIDIFLTNLRLKYHQNQIQTTNPTSKKKGKPPNIFKYLETNIISNES